MAARLRRAIGVSGASLSGVEEGIVFDEADKAVPIVCHGCGWVKVADTDNRDAPSRQSIMD